MEDNPLKNRNFIINLFVNMLALAATAYIVPGITPPATFLGLMWAALVFGFVNAIIRPILTILSLPFIVVTLGLFIFVINGLMLMFVASLTGLVVSGFWAAFFGAVVLSIINMILSAIIGEDKDDDR
jgi:putative membrane protein